MKLIIQIPCYNEAATLGITLRALPRVLPGVDRVEWLVIDDGSTDATVAVAREGGVDHLISLPTNPGAGAGVHGRTGRMPARRGGRDRQHRRRQPVSRGRHPALIAPVIEGRADMVVGARPIDQIAHFSPLKKVLQRLGSRVVQIASNTRVPDAPSGFRAFSRSAATQINVFSSYSYTLETIIQAGQKGNDRRERAGARQRGFAALAAGAFHPAVPVAFDADHRTDFSHLQTLAVFSERERSFVHAGGLIGIRFLYEMYRGHGRDTCSR